MVAKGTSNTETISAAIVKLAALTVLFLIITVDASNIEWDGKEIELMLVGFIGASEARKIYKERRK